MQFEKICLKEVSLKVLKALYSLREPKTAQEIAEVSGLSKPQVNAAVTKSLVRYGFCRREAHLSRLLKKEYNVILITEEGIKYIEWFFKKEKEMGVYESY